MSIASYRRKVTKRRFDDDVHEINVTPVMNLFICLIPFLLISAVFIQLSIIETNAPASKASTAAGNNKPSLVIVMIDGKGFSLAASGKISSSITKPIIISRRKRDYDYAQLTRQLVALKRNDPKAEDLLMVADPTTPYSVLIDTMDAARNTPDGNELFPNAFFGGVL